MAPVEDVRRWAAVRAAGIARLLLHVEGHLVDAEGAADAADPELAAFFARSFVVEAISVAGLTGGGPLERRHLDANFDVFQGVDPALIQRAFALAVAPLEEGSSWDPPAWLDRLRALMHEMEALLKLDEPLPWLRSGEGMFPGLAVARDWMELCSELGVPLPAVASR